MRYPYIQNILYRDPLEIMAYFSEEQGAVFLDSAELRDDCGRYSFIGLDPFLTLRSKNGQIRLNGELSYGDPFQILQQELQKFPMDVVPDLPPFQGGAAGFFSYDLYHHLERIPAHKIDDMQFPDMMVGLFDLVIAFDQVLKKSWVFSSGYPLQSPAARILRAKKRLNWIITTLEKIPTLKKIDFQSIAKTEISANFTAEGYQAAVSEVIESILAGEIFEANISQRFRALLPDAFSPFDLYRRLRELNPAPFAAFLRFDHTILASASPERFLKLQQGQVETRPIKGTRSRGKSPDEDELLAKNLLDSAKDHAENIMIVDLLRNDLSRVCKDGSVQVPQLCQLESYATVHHLVSVVQGTLHEHHQAVDLLRATFPGGSITGAPKIRAMEIIAKIESTARGPYCGSIAYIGFDGSMDSSILIRTFAIKNRTVTFQAGGAIVMDSDPISEYEETLTKASALYAALTHDFINR